MRIPYSFTPAPAFRILFIDAFDSFTNNIVGLLEQKLNAQVTVVHIDNKRVAKNLRNVLKSYDAIVVGPGPGNPANPADVGLINQLWTLKDEDVLPILGICLGFQSLSLAHGAEVVKLREPRHGLVRDIQHNGTDIFSNTAGLRATQYHSLHVRIGTDNNQPVWKPTEKCPSLCPLAWDTSDAEDGPILMAVKHTEKPFWGVQFHPESICTSQEAAMMIQNWWKLGKEWSSQNSSKRISFSSSADSIADCNSDLFESGSEMEIAPKDALHDQISQSVSLALLHSNPGLEKSELSWTCHTTGSVTVVAVCEALGLTRDEIIILDSQNHPSGRFSILGVVLPSETLKISYRSWSRELTYGCGAGKQHTAQLESIEQLWPLLKDIMRPFDPTRQDAHQPARKRFDSVGVVNGHTHEDCPFWGGFMGYISYEAGLETIQVPLHESCASSSIPDVNFAFIHRSIVIDHLTGRTYVQSLTSCDWPWIKKVEGVLDRLATPSESKDGQAMNLLATQNLQPKNLETHIKGDLEERLNLAHITRPEESAYRQKVLDCQDWLRSGDSYELCLTDKTKIDVPRLGGKSLDRWMLYKKLRRTNPAPFGAFLHLSGATVVGSSPERFLSWDRKGHCQLRPIKGTVKKGPNMTREMAHSILNSSKEQAENLMIVDLIRHDLAGICGGENCTVSKLMTVEEYESVYQLVSVIEGQLPRTSGKTGLDVLTASLPPGSMTGAPKKRSCKILRGIEKRPRGIYSGVLGYLDVGGAGDFSVVIRTAVKGWSDREKDYESWAIGAGGAVTVQSSDLGEFLEMETKVASALGAFTRTKD